MDGRRYEHKDVRGRQRPEQVVENNAGAIVEGNAWSGCREISPKPDRLLVQHLWQPRVNRASNALQSSWWVR